MAQVAVYCVLAPIGWLLAECGVFALSTFGNVGGALLDDIRAAAFPGHRGPTIALVAALCLAAIAAHRRSFPALALLAAALFPALDLWIEATECVERNTYADYRIVELSGGGRIAAQHRGQGVGLCRAGRADSLRGRRDARARPRRGGWMSGKVPAPYYRKRVEPRLGAVFCKNSP